MNDQLLNIKTCFNLSNSPKSIVITDETDYAGQSINLADVRGVLTMRDPGGNIFYQNTDFGTPDVDADVSLSTSEISLPLDSEGEVKRGSYTVIYTIDVSGTTYVKTFEYDYSFDLPTPVLDFTVNINAAQVKSVDNTNYGDFLTSLTRLQTVKYPQSLDPVIADETSSLKTFVVGSPIYTKTWTSILESTVEFTLADGLCIKAVLKAVEDLNVTKSLSLCESVDCLKALAVKYEEAKCNNPSLAKSLEKKIILASYYYMLAKEYEYCGEEEKSIEYCVKIKDIAASEGCDCGCSEDDLLPEIIYPLYSNAGSGGNIVIQSGGDGVDVSANTVGGVTTYTLTLNDGITEALGTNWLNGNGAPSSSLGNVGDFYIEDDSSLKNYYKKTGETTWTLQGTLKGADGADGASVTSGITYDGDNPVGSITFTSTDLNTVIEELAAIVDSNSTTITAHTSLISDNTNAINQNASDISDNGDTINATGENLSDLEDRTEEGNATLTNGNGFVREDAFDVANQSGLTADLENTSGGTSYGIDGAGRAIRQASTNLTFVASRDNYVDVDANGVYQSDVPLGDPEPAVSANRVRVAKVSTDKASITAIEDKRRTSFVTAESIEDATITGAKLEELTTAKTQNEGVLNIEYDTKGRVSDITERSLRVHLTTNQLRDLHNTPIVVATGVSGKYMEVISASIFYIDGAVNFNTGVKLGVKCQGSSVNQFETTSTIFANNANTYGKLTQVDAADGDAQFIASGDLILETDGDLGSSGTGDAYVCITYKILPSIAFA